MAWCFSPRFARSLFKPKIRGSLQADGAQDTRLFVTRMIGIFRWPRIDQEEVELLDQPRFRCQVCGSGELWPKGKRAQSLCVGHLDLFRRCWPPQNLDRGKSKLFARTLAHKVLIPPRWWEPLRLDDPLPLLHYSKINEECRFRSTHKKTPAGVENAYLSNSA